MGMGEGFKIPGPPWEQDFLKETRRMRSKQHADGGGAARRKGVPEPNEQSVSEERKGPHVRLC